MKPRKYAPPSPRNTRPKGKFQTRNPTVADARAAAIIEMGRSPTCSATSAMDTAISVATMPARPFMPSTMLSAWVQPPTANMVNSSDTGQNASTQSTGAMPTRLTPPSSHHAMAADRKAASRRLLAPMSLVMSSSSPATKTGITATNNAGHSLVSVMLLGPSTSNPASEPANTAKPPTRGVARVWDACGLLRSLSPVKAPCQRSDATMSPPTVNAATQMYSQVTETP